MSPKQGSHHIVSAFYLISSSFVMSTTIAPFGLVAPNGDTSLLPKNVFLQKS